MNKQFTLLIALLIATAAITVHAENALDYPSIWKCDTEKFNWYCDEQIQKQAPPTSAQPRPQKTIKTAEQLRAELKRREDIAVMNPSDVNLKSYLELWQLTQEKGAVFADNWRRVVWQNPNLDYTLKRPANNAAIKTHDAKREQNEEQHLKTLAKEHGLIFFFKSDCPYCHAMAPTLKMLSEQYGIEILAVSVDSAALLPEFPQFTDGRKQAAAWGIERVPALFIGSKTTGDHAPIGFGQMALTEIVNRIFVLTNTKPGQTF